MIVITVEQRVSKLIGYGDKIETASWLTASYHCQTETEPEGSYKRYHPPVSVMYLNPRVHTWHIFNPVANGYRLKKPYYHVLIFVFLDDEMSTTS